MTKDWTETVLLVCADEARSLRWIERLHDAGCRVVGPASTAGVALTLASQAAPGAALLIGQTTGRRDSSALAGELARLWGVPSFVPGEDAEDHTEGGRMLPQSLRALVRPWAPESDRREHVD